MIPPKLIEQSVGVCGNVILAIPVWYYDHNYIKNHDADTKADWNIKWAHNALYEEISWCVVGSRMTLCVCIEFLWLPAGYVM